MNQKLFFMFIFSFLITIPIESKPIKKVLPFNAVMYRMDDFDKLKPKEELKEETNEEPNEEPKEEPKEDPKEEPKEELKEEPKKETKEEPKEILEKRNHPIIDSFQIVSISKKYF